MKDVNCYLCGSRAYLRLFKQQGHDPYLEIVFGPCASVDLFWNVCGRCGFVYRSPMLDETETARLYEGYETDVFKNSDPDEYFDRIVNLPDDKSENALKTIWLGRVLEEHTWSRPVSSLSVLDVGCGGGTLLYTMREKLGFGDSSAVELNSVYADLARRRSGANVSNCEYEPGLFGKRFDLVVCTKVLEHIADPGSFVASMSRDLAADGLLFLEVPDSSDLYALPPGHERFFIPHLYYFSANTLGVLLAKTGLEVVVSRTTVTHRGRGYLQVVARKTEQTASPIIPYDDPVRLAEYVRRNLDRHHEEGTG